jgi:hypothetical protein
MATEADKITCPINGPIPLANGERKGAVAAREKLAAGCIEPPTHGATRDSALAVTKRKQCVAH